MGQTGLLHRIINQRFAVVAATVAALLLASLISSMVLADGLGGRSIQPSSGSTSATNVEYTVRFTPDQVAGAFVIDFCDSASGPLLGQSCDAPGGMDVSTVATTDATMSTNTIIDANTIAASQAMAAGVEQEITFTGATNPTDAGVMYARIVTFADLASAEAYVSDNPGTGAVDNGAVAMYFNDTIAVSGTVLETMTFCVAGGETPIAENCGGGTELPAPVVTLGEETAPESGVFALEPGVVSTGVLQTQINTNAGSGVVVRLRSSAECGGLKRAGTDECDIAAATSTDIDGSAALFGVKVGTATDLTNATGNYLAYSVDPENPAPYYLTDEFRFNYIEGGATGVTSTFGDPFLGTGGLPATGKNMELTFGAAVTNDTPGGVYSTDLSMIAVGKF